MQQSKRNGFQDESAPVPIFVDLSHEPEFEF